MKKFILLIALSALFCSVPGHAMPGGAEGAAAWVKEQADEKYEQAKKKFEQATVTWSQGLRTLGTLVNCEREEMKSKWDETQEAYDRAYKELYQARANCEREKSKWDEAQLETKRDRQQEAPTHDRQQEKEAPGHASGRPEKAASEAREAAAEALAPAEVLASMQASVTNLEKQATTSCKRLVTALQAWEQETDEAHAKVSADHNLIRDRISSNPLSRLPVKHSDPKTGTYEQENEIAERASEIIKYVYFRVGAAREKAVRAQAYLDALSATSAPEEAAAQGKLARAQEFLEGWKLTAPVAIAGAASEIQELKTLCSETKAGCKTQQEVRAISEKLLKKQKETLAAMKTAYDELLEYEIRSNGGVMALLDDGQGRVEQSLRDVTKCYTYFFGTKPTVDFASAQNLMVRANTVFSLVNKNTEEMMAKCSHDIAFAQGKQAEDELRQQQEAEAARKKAASDPDGSAE